MFENKTLIFLCKQRGYDLYIKHVCLYIKLPMSVTLILRSSLKEFPVTVWSIQSSLMAMSRAELTCQPWDHMAPGGGPQREGPAATKSCTSQGLEGLMQIWVIINGSLEL